MRRGFVYALAVAAFRGQTFNALVKQPACGFQAIYLLLLLADYFIQCLQQIFLISGFYFQLYDPVIIHSNNLGKLLLLFLRQIFVEHHADIADQQAPCGQYLYAVG